MYYVHISRWVNIFIKIKQDIENYDGIHGNTYFIIDSAPIFPPLNIWSEKSQTWYILTLGDNYTIYFIHISWWFNIFRQKKQIWELWWIIWKHIVNYWWRTPIFPNLYLQWEYLKHHHCHWLLFLYHLSPYILSQRELH